MNIEMLQRYLYFDGMYKIKESQGVSPFNKTINPDLNTYKSYPLNIFLNETTGIGKMEFDLNDVVVQGTSESIEYMDEAISSL